MDRQFEAEEEKPVVKVKPKKTTNYTQNDLSGLRVEHAQETFKEGQAVILTLKDKYVLDEAEDDDDDDDEEGLFLVAVVAASCLLFVPLRLLFVVCVCCCCFVFVVCSFAFVVCGVGLFLVAASLFFVVGINCLH